MKYLVNLFFLIFVITNCCSQNFKKNNCSENLEITFLSKSKGKLFFDEHKSTNDYLNIVIDKSGISYKGNYFKSEDEFENSVLIDSTLQKQTNVIIGVENSSPFFCFYGCHLLAQISKFKLD